MEEQNVTNTCIQCGKPFFSGRKDAKFCSDACKMAFHRKSKALDNLTWEGTLIRGQHKGDVPPTQHGIIRNKCRCCRKEFSRWMDSKLARLVRNEMEGIHWGPSSEMDKEKFDSGMKLRLEEVKYCSDLCQEQGPLHWKEVLELQKKELSVTGENIIRDNGQIPPDHGGSGFDAVRDLALGRPKHRGQL